MDRNRETISTTGDAEIRDGAAVFDAAGGKVGTVISHDSQAGYLVVEKGWLFTKDCAIPVSAVAHTDERGISLTLSKDEITYQYKDDLTTSNWDPPEVVDPVSGAVQTPPEYIVGRIPLSGADRSPDQTPATVERVVSVPDKEDPAGSATQGSLIEEMRIHKDEQTEHKKGNSVAQRGGSPL